MGTSSKKLDCVLRYIADFTQTDKKTGKVLAWYKYNGIPSKLQTIMESKLYRLLGYRNDFTIMLQKCTGLLVIGCSILS